MYLEKIKTPNDVKQLNIDELKKLAEEIRSALIHRVSKHGGHVGPNLGFTDATIALHYVFNSPVDKIVYDVSHQSYPHKMLTGRQNAYLYEENFNDVSGYTNPDESAHDFFNIGHTSTSISLASGLAKARDLKGDKENIIAVIGDGSLSGGEALEGLHFAGDMDTNFIIIVNDNDMSIAETHGALRESNGQCECNLFKAMGLDYIYVNDGHNIENLIETFKSVKDIDHPIVIHINTVKGKGYTLAEENRESWHWHMPFDAETGEATKSFSGESYANMTAEFLLKKMKADPKVATIVAALPTSIGFTKARRDEAGKQFIDVGIAEEHAVALASGMAKNGAKPVFATASSFMQRTYDQISQDLCINKNPATLLVNAASIYSMNDVTHLGIFDIAMMANIPELVYLAPTNCEEYFAMLDWSIEQNQYPVAVRTPCNGVIHTDEKVDTDYSNLNKYKITQKGSKIAILALGDFYQIGEALAKAIEEKTGTAPTLVNPRYITGIDADTLESLKADHSQIVTLEDGILDGGFGDKISGFYGSSDIKIYNYGFKREFIDRYKVEDNKL